MKVSTRTVPMHTIHTYYGNFTAVHTSCLCKGRQISGMARQGPVAALARGEDRPSCQQQPPSRRRRNSLQPRTAGLEDESCDRGFRRCLKRSLLSIPMIFMFSLFGTNAGAVSVPEAPARLNLDVINGEEVLITFAAPLSDGGSAVQSYEVRAMFVCCWLEVGSNIGCTRGATRTTVRTVQGNKSLRRLGVKEMQPCHVFTLL